MTEEVDKDNVREVVFAPFFKGNDVMTVHLFTIEEGVPTMIAEIVLTMSKGLVLDRQLLCFTSIAFLPVEPESRVIGGRSSFDHDMSLDSKPTKAEEIVSRMAVAKDPSTLALGVELTPVLCPNPRPRLVTMPAFGIDNLASKHPAIKVGEGSRGNAGAEVVRPAPDNAVKAAYDLIGIVSM